MVINAVELFDEPPDWELVKQIIQSRLVDPYPRFAGASSKARLPLRPSSASFSCRFPLA